MSPQPHPAEAPLVTVSALLAHVASVRSRKTGGGMKIKVDLGLYGRPPFSSQMAV